MPIEYNVEPALRDHWATPESNPPLNTRALNLYALVNGNGLSESSTPPLPIALGYYQYHKIGHCISCRSDRNARAQSPRNGTFIVFLCPSHHDDVNHLSERPDLRCPSIK